MLYIVSTPIGNLSDISLRALEILQSVDLIACEDTRQSAKLLAHFSIKKPLTSYFEHNQLKKGEYLLRLLKEGKDIALISDAGTPGINDPGFVLIRQAIENNLEISAIPGPCALTNALVLSGLASDRFIFEGYLPVKKISRQKKLAALAKEERTLIFYESPHRFLKALENIAQVFPERKIAVCREMTKKFEEVKRGTAGELLEYYKTKRILGELVILIAGEK